MDWAGSPGLPGEPWDKPFECGETHGLRVLGSIVLMFPYRLSLGLFFGKDPSGSRGL